MRAKILSLVIAGLTFLAAVPSQAGLVAFWSFDNSSTATTLGSGTFTTSGTVSYPTAANATTLNDPRPSPTATPAMQFSSAGGYLQIQVVGTGLSSFVLSYAGLKTGNSGSQSWEYSLNGTTWTAAPTSPKVGPSWAAYTVDFSAITALNNQTSVFFRDTFSSDLRYDNFQVNAVPEPVHYALAAFALIFAGVRTGRFYLARRRAA